MSKVKRLQVRTLSDVELIQLAGEVEAKQCLWDLSNEEHKKSEAIESAWQYIASVTGFTVVDCKKGWKSLKDKLRYRLSGKVKGQTHSGDSGGEDSQSDPIWNEEQNERFLEAWKFGDCMRFLVRKPYSRRTLTTDVLPVHTNQDSLVSDGFGELSAPSIDMSPAPSPLSQEIKSNYDYASRKRKVDDVGEKLVKTVTELVNIRKEQKTNGQLKYQAMLTNLDTMLSKLPEDMVEDLSFEFVRLTHEKLKEYRSTQLIHIEYQ